MSNGVSGSMVAIGVMDGAYSELCGVHSGVAGDDMESCDGALVDRDDDAVCGMLGCIGKTPPLSYRSKLGMLMTFEQASRSREDVDAGRGSEAYKSSSPSPSASSKPLRPFGPTMARITSTRCCIVRPSLEPWVLLFTCPWATSTVDDAVLPKQRSVASSNKMS